ncbi:MAG: radical SAM protein [Candidatus Liptonbacteria bacterium CG11_big_fil_rev_8_21_14_0_20_35_14]|uniref:Radical SAM protein n=1 Tax=Candidatus Liptonbacteria bacterium CG11_big_fil_rev_8_21_14_0_20_35_14 TaxID=1974634 RepID=A0A2H0N860_9BACT|nr:MAG: radical SAM protein [Candidatus Liptonbacteria bacterium CG11_big_fil_rev_8_21_14_0_20_35_14]
MNSRKAKVENIGWTLGNECPYRCFYCYSMLAREKGKNLFPEAVERIVQQLSVNEIKTVNLGGNEPLFTNGINPKDTLLPFIIEKLIEKGIVVGLTTAGITINYLAEHYSKIFQVLNDVDVSLDSPYPEEHNTNRRAPLFKQALATLNLCKEAGIEHTIVMCGMSWNLSDQHIDDLIDLARKTSSNVRINYLKPTEVKHLHVMPSAKQFYGSAQRLISASQVEELGEPLLESLFLGSESSRGCPCGVKSFRIHSITPDGRVPVSPCVYLHSYRVGDLLVDDLYDIINSPQFEEFRKRNSNPDKIDGCANCSFLSSCRGGCAARSFLCSKNKGMKGLWNKDPYCLLDFNPDIFLKKTKAKMVQSSKKILVHKDYLCTLIVSP